MASPRSFARIPQNAEGDHREIVSNPGSGPSLSSLGGSTVSAGFTPLGPDCLDGEDNLPMPGPKVRRHSSLTGLDVVRTNEWYHTAFLLLADIVGTGVLSLMGAFAKVGWLPGVLLLLVWCVVTRPLAIRLRVMFDLFYFARLIV